MASDLENNADPEYQPKPVKFGLLSKPKSDLVETDKKCSWFKFKLVKAKKSFYETKSIIVEKKSFMTWFRNRVFAKLIIIFFSILFLVDIRYVLAINSVGLKFKQVEGISKF